MPAWQISRRRKSVGGGGEWEAERGRRGGVLGGEEQGDGLTGLLGYTWARWPFSLPTVQSRQQVMVWSVYFWFGALITSVTGGPATTAASIRVGGG